MQGQKRKIYFSQNSLRIQSLQITKSIEEIQCVVLAMNHYEHLEKSLPIVLFCIFAPSKNEGSNKVKGSNNQWCFTARVVN